MQSLSPLVKKVLGGPAVAPAPMKKKRSLPRRILRAIKDRE